MKHLTFYTLILVLAVTLSACGAQPVPTVSGEDIQRTAEAAAFTVVAQTQLAMPTSTPIPPTDTPTNTPLPTDTPASVPTNTGIAVSSPAAGASPIATVAVSNGNGNATADPCSTRVLSGPPGKETTIRIVNKTKVPIKVSVYLNETAGQGACGWGYVEISKLNDTVITSWVQGCYNLWAWSDDPKGKFNSSGYGCINNSDKWTFEVSEGSIKFVGP